MDGSIKNLLNFLVVAEFSQVVLLVFILFAMEKNKRANIFFAAFLISLSSDFFCFYLADLNIKLLTVIIAVLSIPGISILGTLIYFYAMFITGILEKFRFKNMVHFIVYFINFVLFTSAVYNVYNIKGATPESEPIKTILFIVLSIGFVNSILYMIYTLAVLKRYYKRIENYYSDLEKMNLNWLVKITTLSFIVVGFWCVTFWLANMGVIPKSLLFMVFNVIMFIAVNFITAYYLVNQPEIFRWNIEMNQAGVGMDSSLENGKYLKQNIDEIMQEEYSARLDSYMAEHKPYLNETITIKELADEVNIPTHHLSIVINSRYNKNFYTFINEYRIREAIEIIDNPQNSDANILSIAFRAGFNSKTTFNNAFKKITGFTPTAYRDAKIREYELAR